MRKQWRRITPQEIAEHKLLEYKHGNGSQAVREKYPTMLHPGDRAWRIQKMSEKVNALEFIENSMQQIGIDAIQRVGEMVNSSDEGIATRNSHFVLEQIRGKAVQKTENKTLNINIETVLD